MKDLAVHNDLNDVIDCVAQELTSAPPPVNLRARVLDRIATEPVRRRLASGWQLLLVPVAVATIVFVIARQYTEPRAVLPARPVVQSAQSTPSPATVTTSAPAPPTATAIVSRAGNRRIHRATAEELAWRERAVAALTLVDPIDLTDIQPTPLSIPQLEVKPLGTADGGSPNGGSIDRHD